MTPDASAADSRVDLEPARSRSLAVASTVANETAPRDDYFVERDGQVFAGTHLLLDMWGAEGLTDEARIEAALTDAVAACGATLLSVHVHRFAGTAGVSGVAVLAESHISIHTWPERDFAAVDIFMCGTCDAYAAIPVLRRAFAPDSMHLAEQRRGVVR